MLRERVVHPRVKVTLLADLTLATASIVPFTLSIAVAATIDPYFAFSSLPLPTTFRQQTLPRLFRPPFLLSIPNFPSFLPSFWRPLSRTPLLPLYIPGSRLFLVDRLTNSLSLFFSLSPSSYAVLFREEASVCFSRGYGIQTVSRSSRGISNRIDIKRQPRLILTIAEKRLRCVGGALVPGL